MAFTTGLRILLTAFVDLFGNFPAAMRITLPWFGPVVALIILTELAQVFGWDFGGYNFTVGFLLFFAAGVYLAVALPALAISWHRFILRNQPTDHPFALERGWLVGSYLFWAIAISIILLLVLLPYYVLHKVLYGSFTNEISTLWDLGLIPTLAHVSVEAWLQYIALRLSVLLPAIALEDRNTLVGQARAPHTIKEAWRTTKPLSVAIFVVAAVLIALTYLLLPVNNMLSGQSGAPHPNIADYAGYIVLGMVSLCWMMFQLSILTTLYGHLWLDRPLIANRR